MDGPCRDRKSPVSANVLGSKLRDWSMKSQPGLRAPSGRADYGWLDGEILQHRLELK
jgi:hypothetical protein